jgi:hypothetical protein
MQGRPIVGQVNPFRIEQPGRAIDEIKLGTLGVRRKERYEDLAQGVRFGWHKLPF